MKIQKVWPFFNVTCIDSVGGGEYSFPACDDGVNLAETLAKNAKRSSQVIHKTE